MRSDELLRRMRELRSQMDHLGGQLKCAAEDLQATGTPLPSELLERCAQSTFTFEQLVADFEESSGTALGNDHEGLPPRTMDHLLELMDTFQRSARLQNLVCDAQAIIDEAERIEPQGISLDGFSSQLRSRVNAARKLFDSESAESHAQNILDGSHPLAALRMLVQAEAHGIADDEADRSADIVGETFGRAVERAALRSKLRIGSEKAPNESSRESPSEPPCNDETASKLKVEAERAASEPIASAIIDDNSLTLPDTEQTLDRAPGDHVPPAVSGLQLGEPSPAENECELEPTDVRPEPEPVSFDHGAHNPVTITQEREHLPNSPTRSPEQETTPGSPAIADIQADGLPPTCSTFDAFCESYFLSSNGDLEPYPWRVQPARYGERLREAAGCKLTEKRFSHLWVICAALEELDTLPPVRTIDLAGFAELARESSEFNLLSSADGTQRLRAALADPASEPNLAVTLFLELLRPRAEQPLSDAEIDDIARLAFASDDPLRAFAEKTLKLHARDIAAIDLLSERLGESKVESPAQLEIKLQQRCGELRDIFKRMWSAAGGKIRTTHSRHAWEEFIQFADSALTHLTDVEKARRIENPTNVEKQIRKLSDYARRICDRKEVYQNDRKKFDRSVAELQTRGMAVLQVVQQFRQVHQHVQSQNEHLIPIEELRGLLARESVHDVWAALICAVLIKIFEPQRESTLSLLEPSRWMLTAADLCGYPGLVPFFSPELFHQAAEIDPGELTPAVAAARCLMVEPEQTDTPDLDSLRQRMLSRGRFDLLRHLIDNLTASDKAELRRYTNEQTVTVNRQLTDLRRLQRELQQMAVPLSAPLHDVIREAERLRENILDDTVDVAMLKRWLGELVEFAGNRVAMAEVHLRNCVEALPHEQRAPLESKLRTRQFAEVLFAMGEERPHQTLRHRETLWRDAAEETFAEPAIALSRSVDQPPIVTEFIQEWRHGYGGTVQADRPIRTKFARLMFSSTERDRDKPDGRNEAASYRASCQNIIEWFTSQKLNPTFLPQLRQYQDLVILTPLEKRDSPSLVEQIRAQAAKEFGQESKNLGVFLAPKLSGTRRADVIREFNHHGLRASIIDDLDICRLLNPGGQRINLLMGLIELILEQQPLNTFMPYQRHDGQHVRQEMFVGRAEQAREIAETTQYSRLFSGRKLGKSALLSYVQQTYDGSPLSSGNRLRVLYISGVGAAEETEFVQRVLEELEKRIGIRCQDEDAVSGSGVPGARTPSERLVRAFEQFNTAREGESLLVLFDEADLFMERQIADYELKKEECVSFAIRSLVEAVKDKAGLPRVRFLFSGYRVTHRSDGAWTGAWGDVLRLEPLAPEDAATLVRGPLERLGIQAADLAPTIAWRCGYQPALIINFCRQLLQQKTLRQGIDDEAVAATFEHTNVQDEIRSIIDSNFQGNRLSRIVFLAALWTFAERGASAGITDLPQELHQRLAEIEPEFAWLHASDAKSAMNRIEDIVDDLVRRQLLRQQRGGSGLRTYYARFPHHVPTLARDLVRDPTGTIRQQIAEYQRGHLQTEHASQVYRSLYATQELEFGKRLLASDEIEVPVDGIVFPDGWPDAVPIAELSPGHEFVQINASTADTAPEIFSKRLVLIGGATAKTVDAVSCRGSGLPPVLLCGSAQLLRSVMIREQKEEALFHVVCLGRISQPALQWWFNRKRAMEFEGNGINQIAQVTSGIPALVKWFDDVLSGEHGVAGANVGNELLDKTLRRFERELPQLGKAIFGGNSNALLTRRETDIARMIARLSVELEPSAPLHDWLMEWDELYAEETEISGVQPSDVTNIKILQSLGLVPINPAARSVLERLIAVDRSDALLRALKASETVACD